MLQISGNSTTHMQYWHWAQYCTVRNAIARTHTTSMLRGWQWSISPAPGLSLSGLEVAVNPSQGIPPQRGWYSIVNTWIKCRSWWQECTTKHWTRPCWVPARDTYNFSSCENGAFLLMEATACCPFYYWSEIEVVLTKIIVQSAYTSVIERSLLKWNGRDCNGWMHYAIGFYCCHVTMFWNLIGTANFQAAEVTVWTRGSCQADSPTAWERG